MPRKKTTTKSAPKQAAEPKAKPRQKAAPQPPEAREGAPRSEILGFVLIGAGIMALYFLIADAASGNTHGAVGVLAGLFGVLKWALPFALLFAGIRTAMCKKAANLTMGAALGVLLALLVTALVHTFVVDGIARSLPVSSFTGFVQKSYRLGYGGGAVGALFCWPLYQVLGMDKTGTVLILFLLIIGDLVLMNKLSLKKFGEKVQKGYADARTNLEKRRTERETQATEKSAPPERDFDLFAERKIVPKRPLTKQRAARVPRHFIVEKINPAAEPRATVPSDVPNFLRNEPMPEAPVAEPEIAPVTEEPSSIDVYDLPQEDDLPPFEPDAEDVPEAPIPEEPVQLEIPMFLKNSRGDAPQPKKETMKKEATRERYSYPPIDILHVAKTQQQNISQGQNDQIKGQKLVDTLASFGIAVSLVGIAHGPTVTRFELSPAPGVKVSRITSLADDIALNLAAVSVRIEAPIPGKAAVGVEVPNDVIETVPLREVLESDAAKKNPSHLAAGLGRDNAGRFIICDLSKMPHLLIAGQTGSGKSVCINSIICSILYRASPEEVRMILIDPKVVELSAYNGIPHLLVPVVTDPKKAAGALGWAVTEMQQRYKKFADAGVRDIKGFNARLPEGEEFMPQIVIIIDELADLMMVAPGDVEDAICRLAQLARAAGIYLVIATQRPSVNVITGVIKANIPSRIAFTVASQVDSRTILDYGGAEKLLGRGDMLYAPSGIGKPWRAQGAWVSDDEVHEVVDYIRTRHTASYNEDVIEHLNNLPRSDAEREEAAEAFDELLPDAVSFVVEQGQASTSMLQRRLRIGYARAGRLIDEMEKRGIVSPGEGSKARSVLMTREQFRQLFGEDAGQP
ncbi:MAG: DNA translocase FtsK [Christensenellales bacterium]|jgi:S-DNA-T family DNA segregation ATPase FtsK/SpoIIIE